MDVPRRDPPELDKRRTKLSLLQHSNHELLPSAILPLHYNRTFHLAALIFTWHKLGKSARIVSYAIGHKVVC